MIQLDAVIENTDYDSFSGVSLLPGPEDVRVQPRIPDGDFFGRMTVRCNAVRIMNTGRSLVFDIPLSGVKRFAES